MRHRFRSLCASFILGTALSGCVAKAYDGAPLQLSELAIVYDDTQINLSASRRVRVFAVDGRELPRAFNSGVALAPGVHTLELKFQQAQSGGLRSGLQPCWITRYFHAGHEYRIGSELASGIWRARLIDQNTGEYAECVFVPPGETA